MKKISFLALFLPIALNAQTGIIVVHPAVNEGKSLTMEEAIMSRDVYPARSSQLSNVVMNLEEEGVSFRDKKDPEVKIDGRNLYIIENGVEKLIAQGTDDNRVSNGQTVSRNEFGIDKGVFWSPDGSKLAFYRKDESKVTDFPLLDITTRTGSLKSIPYPMNGMDSERISLGVYDKATGNIIYMDVTDFGEDRYLTNISWGPDGKYIFIQVLDRTQKHMHLNQYRADNGNFVRTILTEDNSKYVEPLDPIRFIGSNYHFVYRTNNRDSYRNLYLCDTLGGIKRITPCDADVEFNKIVGNDIFYTSAEVSPIENHLFKVSIKPAKGKNAVSAAKATISKPIRLTQEEGWHNVIVSNDGKWMVDSHSSFNVPRVQSIKSTDGKTVKYTWSADDPLKEYATGEIILGTVKSADGKYDNYYRLYKPSNFDPTKKYPVVVYVYGGPHSQMVQNSWLGSVRMWEELMAQKGYVVYVQDNRGTQNRGIEFEQAIHRNCGQAEMADQMVGVEMLKSLPWVDADRIGVHGWSYGGFMTISLMTNYPETFKVGVAGGPVIDWKWYEIMYGERYMETEATNPEGFAKTSLINKAADLKGKLLICQGAIDNTVVWEHSLSFVQKCIEENVQLDYFPYPRSEHNVFGKWRVHLMDKVTEYFEDYL